MKIEGQDKPRLVKAYTKAGAERFVRDTIKPKVTATLPSQAELVDALKAGIVIEDSINDPQASIPEPSQVEPEPASDTNQESQQ